MELNRNLEAYVPLFRKIEALIVIEPKNLQDVYRLGLGG